MTTSTKAWMNRFLQLDRFVTVSVTATQNHRFIASVSFDDAVGNSLKMVSTVASESPETALETLWKTLEEEA